MAINGDDINISKRPDMIVNLTNDDNYKFTKRIEEAYIADDKEEKGLVNEMDNEWVDEEWLDSYSDLKESLIINNPNAKKLRISGIGHKRYIKLETEQNGREK